VLSFEFCDLSHLRLIGLATLFSPFYLLPVSRELRSYYHYRTIKSWMAICHAINFSKKKAMPSPLKHHGIEDRKVLSVENILNILMINYKTMKG
jgi:hypothetical protein